MASGGRAGMTAERVRNALVLAALAAVLASPGASAAAATESTEGAGSPAPATATEPQPASTTAAPAASAVKQGATLTAPSVKPAKQDNSGGTGAGSTKTQKDTPSAPPAPAAAPNPTQALVIPSIPTSTCAGAGVPPVLAPIYRRAATAYGLGPQGPSVLAGINEVETAFGTNLNVSSAGAQGWMQFMPSTWETYGVDANGDGV